MPGYAIQQQNEQLISLLSARFRLLDNPAHAWGDVFSMYKSLPGLVSFWSCSSTGLAPTDVTGLFDDSGKGLNLGANSVPMIGINESGLLGYIAFDGTDDYFFRTDAAAADISGAESVVETAYRGMTIGAWVYFSGGLGPAQQIIGKDGLGANRSYILYKSSSDLFTWLVTGNGTTVIEAAHTTPVTTGQWYFVACRFIASTEIRIWVDSADSVVNTISVPASIFNSTAQLSIAARSVTPDIFLNGRLSLLWMTKTALPEASIRTLYNFTAPLFGHTL